MCNKENENYVYEYIGRNIQKYRKKKGWTQEQLASKSSYSKQFISNIENNSHQTFSLGTLWHIAKTLDVDMYKLCIDSPDDNNNDDETTL